MWSLANPTRFLALAARLRPWLLAAAVVLLAVGLAGAGTAPDDYQQGATVKIMYVHVPAAWLGMAGWIVMSVSALGTLVWRHPLADVSLKAAAPIGAAFTAVCLVSGSLWGRPEWGTWWEWDARLTSMLVQFIMYLGVLALWHAVEEPGRAAKACAVLVLVGAVNIPVIKFSVDWWNTLHQGESIFRADGPAIPPAMLWPLGVMALGFTVLFAWLQLGAMRNEVLRRRLRTMRVLAAQGAGASHGTVAAHGTGLRPGAVAGV